MRKTVIKKATSPKKTKVVNKKKVKPSKKQKLKSPTKQDYPQWTTPEHLQEKDHKDLKRVYDLYSKGKFKEALNYASNLDTAVREEIPAVIWRKIGGKLNIKVAEKKSIQKKQSSSEVSADSSQKPEPVEIKFKSDKELEQLVLTNSNAFFGENAFLFKDKSEVKDEHFPDKFLLDFTNSEKPRLYLIEVILPDQSFGQCFVRITHYFAILQNRKNQNDFIWKLYEIVNSNKEQKKELQTYIPKGIEIPEFLASLLDNRPLVLLITGGEKSELSLLVETYTETWGKMLKTLIIRKYENEGETTYPVNPAFADLLKNDKSKTEIVKSTEEDHLNATSETVRNIYNEIKTALLKADGSIEFRAKKIYISVRKNKNLAFFHLRKKSISLVVMNPEDDTRKQIKHHEIKSLPASVQKFWNGPSCTIVIENSANIAEVINLLKKMIAKTREGL
jgi:predicted transport protein